jgi:hypothetical protein
MACLRPGETKRDDLTMIDISDDAWFDLDLAHYQEQLVNGYTRMTPQAGLQIFMPDIDEIHHKKESRTPASIGLRIAMSLRLET